MRFEVSAKCFSTVDSDLYSASLRVVPASYVGGQLIGFGGTPRSRCVFERLRRIDPRVSVIFFTSRVTSARREWSSEVNAQIVTSTSELLNLLSEMALKSRLRREFDAESV